MSSRDRRRDPPLPRLVIGVAIIAIGAIFWLDKMGRIEASDYFDYWPLALLAMGIAQLAHRRWFAAAVWLLFGFYFALPLVGVSQWHFWRIVGLWPLMISAGGVMLIAHALRGGERSVRATAVMGGNVQRLGAQFSGGEAVAVMGGSVIDLSAATLTGEATLDVLSFWGGVEVIVPRGWKVVSRLSLILGGLVMKIDPAPDGAPQLVMRGGAIMGGVDVHHPKERA